MSILNLQASYFAIENPLRWFERCFNRFRHRGRVRINQREIGINWTTRAERQMQRLDRPLIAELQLYFSCVVKKRVLFHRQVEFDTTAVNAKLEIAFRPIASAVCDPLEFAARYPQGKDLGQGRAARMIPQRVEIDYRRGRWEGRFSY